MSFFKSGLSDKSIELDASRLRVLLSSLALPPSVLSQAYNRIIRFDAATEQVQYYPKSGAGFTSAISDVSSDDLVLLPPGTISLSGGDIVSTDCTISGYGRESSILTTSAAAHTLIIRAAVTLINIGVNNSNNSGSYHALVVDDAAGQATVINSVLWGDRAASGAGSGHGAQISAGNFFGVGMAAYSNKKDAINVSGGAVAIRESTLRSEGALNYACVQVSGGTVNLNRNTLESDATAWHLRRTAGTVNISGCRYSHSLVSGTINYSEGDRSAYDALNSPSIHANDTDDSVSAIHHTLGTGANQAAAGNHTHTLSDADAIHDNVGGEINGITEKTTPVSADLVIIEDSADSYSKKKMTVGNLLSIAGSGNGSQLVWEPVTDGVVDSPSLIFNNGDVVMNGVNYS